MTNEQAIAMISHIKEYIVDNQGDKEYGGALDMAIEALEKQIPMATRLECDGPEQWLVCPSCGDTGVEDERPYCKECGQAIDWSEFQEDSNED